jgi:hypothetical protein
MLQSIIFPKSKFSLLESIDWLMTNGYKTLKVHETEDFYRFRQAAPLTGGRYRTKTLDNGVELILHYK